VDRGRQLTFEDRQQTLDAVGDGDGVGAGLALNGQDDGAVAVVVVVEPRGRLVVFHAVDDVAQLLQAHRGAAAIGHHHRPVLRGVHQLAAGHEGKGALRADDRSGGQIDVPVPQRGFDFIQPDLVGGQRVRVHLHVNRVFLRAQHLHLRHTTDGRDALRNAGFRVFIECPQRECFRSQREVQDGLVRRVHLGEGGRSRHVGRQQARALRDRRLHVHGCPIQLPAQVEFEGDLGRALGVGRAHRVEPGDQRKLVLERGRDRRSHRLGTRARQAGGHQQRREIDVRQVADRKAAVGDGAKQSDRAHQKAGRNRPLDKCPGDVHLSISRRDRGLDDPNGVCAAPATAPILPPFR